ncbi:MAG: phosphoglucosamine mutase [Planctomycetes bacterium]|nr:phosphoglucosamine mutase [Planctomycetota bacterium]
MTGQRYFGTDGIRDVANHGLLSPENVLAIARSLARELTVETTSPTRAPRVLIGRDPRRSSPLISAQLAAGLLSSGVDVVDGGILPTPAVALLVRETRCDAGIVVSASHNPASDNGIKIFGPTGEKLADILEDRIEAGARAGLAPAGDFTGVRMGRHDVIAGARLYAAALAERFRGLSLAGRRVAVDCANGALARIAPAFLRGLGADVVARGVRPDGININARVGALHPECVQSLLVAKAASFGVAFDGDGDRAVFVDERGTIRDGDDLLFVASSYLAARGRLPGGAVVGTVMSNAGLESALRDLGIALRRAPVGDRYVAEAIRHENLALGAEPSGHALFNSGDGLIGDGLRAALELLRIVADTGAPLSELARGFERFPQVQLNVPVRSKPPLDDVPEVKDAMSRAARALAGSGRIVLRYSGTEPLARVMIEGRDQDAIHELAESIAAAIRSRLGA